MAIQIELPFSVKKEVEAEHTIISDAAKNKNLLQMKMTELQKRQVTPDDEGILCLDFNMRLTQVCDSKQERPDAPRVYLRRISGQITTEGFIEKDFTLPKFDDAVIPTWVDALFLRQNWVGRELLAEMFRQIAGLKYAESVWRVIASLIKNEKDRIKKENGLNLVMFNHSIMPSEFSPSDTEAVAELIKEGENTFKFLKQKANEAGIILVGEYRNFFPSDRFIMDVEKKKICGGYSLKKHFDTDYLLLNNALSPIQDISSKGWPKIIYPPSIEDDNFGGSGKDTYLYAKWFADERFCCYEVVGDIDKSSLVKLASYIQKRESKREEQPKQRD